MPAGRYLAFSFIVALIAGLVFVPGLPGQFIFDDLPNITANEAVHLTELSPAALADVLVTPQLSGTTRALPTLSFALDYWRAGGPEPGAFKASNIVLHMLTAFALAGFFRSLLLVAGVPQPRAQWAALALALAWAVHPLQVSAVLYAVQRIQTMGTFFLVLALWAYLLARQAQIEGRSGRTGLFTASLLWVLAMGCKEDSVLLPAYALALELTVLGFAADDDTLARRLRRGYLLAVIAALAVYFLAALPHYWQGSAYHGRDFSAGERILTQPRMLAMYLWQILVPLPGHMPFYYDWVQPSRSLLQPWTTLPALGLVLLLLGIAWRIRSRMPLLALGILVYFSAHALTSNVVGLELAFEHRNHFALIGAVLAIGALLAGLGRRLQVDTVGAVATCAVLLTALCGATLLRAHSWSSTEGIARAATESAPGSGRAWTQLCAQHFANGGGVVANNSRLDEAIDTCRRGADAAPESLGSAALLVVLKSHRGDAEPRDWTRFRERLETVPMTRDNARTFATFTFHASKGVALDKDELIKTLDGFARHGDPAPYYLATMGYFIMGELEAPDAAMPYFIQAIEASPVRDPFPQTLAAELNQMGRPDLARRAEDAGAARDATEQVLAR